MDHRIEQADEFICYLCKGDDCEHCVGVPCMCECPDPMVARFDTEKALEEMEL